jgi:hypothetical protein
MSIRAYRVIKIETAKPNSFNLYHDSELVDFFDREYGFYEYISEGTGLTELPVEALKEALDKLKLDEDLREALRGDIQAAEEAGKNYVQYYCF